MADKMKALKLVNISDSINAFCLGSSLLFYPSEFPYLLAFLGVTFLCSGLALRRYGNGKPMMRFGTSSDIEKGDAQEIVSSYNHHLFTITASSCLMMVVSIYHLYTVFSI